MLICYAYEVNMTDPFRMKEWNALPDICMFEGCEYDDIDQRGPIFLRDGSMHKACEEHWVAIIGVLGRQTMSHDAMRYVPDGVNGPEDQYK